MNFRSPLFRVDDDIWSFDLDVALSELPEWRREYALKYRFEKDRRLSVAAFRLLKRLLEERFALEEVPRFSYGPRGKPYFAEYSEIHFNLSHTSKAVACIVAEHPVGIDIEEIAPVDWEVAKRVLSEQEIDEVRETDSPDAAFAQLWTMKEALIKLKGEGIDESKLPSLLFDHPEVHIDSLVHPDRGYALALANPRAASCCQKLRKDEDAR